MKKYHLKNLDCAACAAKIEDGLRTLKDVKFVNVSFASLTMTIDADDMEKVKDRIKELEPDVEVEDRDEKQRMISKSELAENKTTIIKAVSGTVLLIAGIVFENQLSNTFFHIAKYALFIIAYLIAGWNVLASAVRNIRRGQVFNEQFLMSVATLGAFAINEMAEAVAVMLFYVVGELFQDVAVGRSRRSIKALLEIKPEYANLKAGSEIRKVSPEEVKIGDIIIVKAGEKVPLDGIVTGGSSFVDTSALSGESVPRKVEEHDEIMAGVINQSGLLTIEVKKRFGESSISRILELVENATSRKAKTENFITTFARYYTPVVVFGALLLAVLPPLLISGQTFSEWIYRALVVLVVSCPCALVISIPLGYFGGVGRASQKGILVKGSNFLDALNQVETVVFDKTGTLTKGEFKVSEVVASSSNGFSKDDILEYAAYAEYNSNHPVAKSILDAFHKNIDHDRIAHTEEISGYGIKAVVDGKEVLVGNDKLLHREDIDHPVCDVDGTVVFVVIDRKYAGYIVISDSLKPDSTETIARLNKRGIRTVMLTGDNENVAQSIAKKLKIDRYYPNLLPEDKVDQIEKLIRNSKRGKVVFVGDGINDAPVIARADVGMAMGALGSDAAIETADVVLMTDSPSKVIDAIDVAAKTRNVVWQNIIFAMGVKAAFIILGIFGIASMWEAVFGDMGVALIAVFNAIRILK
ncbi:heavy metal translocating P-type ATPase [Anaerophaga thermohalophila]|uniref:heavy metal translocating P-type ATPase n=1 Tax=Anaerophaga thermohalophila TaxID=177400 RepID=UPI0002FE8B41|nr:heavy metal translocating P-type ATPase [Anaerophaga thermohalophila]